MSAQYWLAAHAYVCRTARHVIFLDLRHDAYHGLAASDAATLAGQIAGFDTITRGIESSGREPEALLKDLLAAGLLVGDPRAGKPASQADTTVPTTALIEGYARADAPIRVRDLIRFVIAVVRARWQLRFRSLESVARRVEWRRLAHPPNHKTPGRESIRTLVSVYRRLRPLLLTANQHCLLDSLALCEFLAAHRYYPAWIFGVVGEPFAAHCWLQDQHVVVDDLPSNVRSYAPILIL
ncbi:MAG: lasso peptide biosynthesis B2 protein [Gammaproteobacteria bacterium]